MDDNQTVKEALTIMPEEGSFLSVSNKMDEEGIKEIIFKKEQSLPELMEFNRNHRFNNIKAFIKYVDRYKLSTTTLYYDSKNSKCHCLLDELDTIGGPVLLECSIDDKSLFYEIERLENIRNGADFLEYIKGNKRSVENFAELFHLMSAIKVSSSIERLDIQGKNSENSFIIKTEVKGQVRGEPKELPDSLSVYFNDYAMDFNQAPVYQIMADIYYSASKEGTLSIQIKVNNKKELKNMINSVYYKFIEENAPEGVLVTIGEPNLKPLLRHNDF